MIDTSIPLITYSTWKTSTDISWMTADGFFLGNPVVTLDAPTSATIRAAVYAYIDDLYATRYLGVRSKDRWTQLYRSALTRANGVFWKMWQMDQLLKIKDMVTADYSAFVAQYNQGSSAQQAQHTGISENTSTGRNATKSKSDPVTVTSTDRSVAGTVTTTTTPQSAAKTVNLSSELAESTYTDPVAGLNAGMPSLDTSHGDRASGQWSISEGSQVMESYGVPSGEITQTTGIATAINENVNSNANASSNAQADYIKNINNSVGGNVTTGHRDYNGYNLTASIEAVVKLLPYDYLKSVLDTLFYGVNNIFGEDGGY